MAVEAGGRKKRTEAEAAMSGVPDIEREIFIGASPETVFRFFVEPAFMVRWFGQRHTLDPRPGGIFRVEVSAANFEIGRAHV